MTDINVDFDKCGFFAKKFLNGYMTANLIELGTNRYGFIISIFDLSYNFIGSYADYIYINLDLTIEQVKHQFNDFIETIKSRSRFDFDVDVNENDNILTLSTCANNNKYRVVLHAKKIKN